MLPGMIVDFQRNVGVLGVLDRERHQHFGVKVGRIITYDFRGLTTC